MQVRRTVGSARSAYLIGPPSSRGTNSRRPASGSQALCLPKTSSRMSQVVSGRHWGLSLGSRAGKRCRIEIVSFSAEPMDTSQRLLTYGQILSALARGPGGLLCGHAREQG